MIYHELVIINSNFNTILYSYPQQPTYFLVTTLLQVFVTTPFLPLVDLSAGGFFCLKLLLKTILFIIIFYSTLLSHCPKQAVLLILTVFRDLLCFFSVLNLIMTGYSLKGISSVFIAYLLFTPYN